MPKAARRVVPDGADVPASIDQGSGVKRRLSSENSFPAKRTQLEPSKDVRTNENVPRPTGIHAVKPLTKTNLELLQDSMSNPGCNSRKASAPHRPVSALTSSDRSLTQTEVSETSSISRTHAATSPKFLECLIECGLDSSRLERPNQKDLQTLRSVLARERDSPEPDSQIFHLTREKVHDKNEVSVAIR